MGVKTHSFGPCTWVMLEGISQYYDDLPPKIQTEQKNTMCCLMYMVGFLLPCIHCRISFRRMTYCRYPKIHIETTLQQEGAKALTYGLHYAVTDKLIHQGQTNKKHIGWQEALDNGFPEITSDKFWYNFTKSLAFMCCDLTPDRQYYLGLFLKMMSALLSSHCISPIFQKSLSSILPFVDRAPQQYSCQEYVNATWNFYNCMEQAYHRDPMCSQDELNKICQSSIL
jgi:hypothetical protein